MKKRYMFCMFFIVIILTIHFAAGGLIGSQKQESFEYLVADKAVSATAADVTTTLATKESIQKDKSIFSKTTVFSLIVAVVGIIAFRRNIYS